jgi:serine/threonine protein kinase
MAQVATAEDDDPESFPRAFGQYLLLENFARGGMGEVYLAKSGGIAGLERYCVLKKLRSELTRDREYVTRFIDEARVVVTLQHRNICHVFDVGRVGDEYYLAMEYVSGRDVRTIQDRCRAKGRVLPPATSLLLVCETLEALDYAHRRNHPSTGEALNLVHRDVSPQNVLVSFEGDVKLIDFGLAASKLKVERTQPNVVMGKMAYMAPEQARGDPIDLRADLFACGVLAYELLAGERFYEGMTANDIWQVAGKGGFIPPKWSSLDPALARLLARALHPDPKKRYASCGDFREALAEYLHNRYPGTGVRGIRDAMSELFSDEVRKERELFTRFGKVTVAGFRTTFEETKSQSVSLARASDSDEHSGASLVRNEQSSSAPAGPMPAPDAAAASLPVRASDVHVEPTRLVSQKNKEATLEQKSEGSTDEGEGSATAVRPPRDDGVEATQRVQRAPRNVQTSPTITRFDELEQPGTLEATRPGHEGSRKWLVPAALLGAVVLAAGAFVVTSGEKKPPVVVAEKVPPLPPPPPVAPPPPVVAPPQDTAPPPPPVETAPPPVETGPPPVEPTAVATSAPEPDDDKSKKDKKALAKKDKKADKIAKGPPPMPDKPLDATPPPPPPVVAPPAPSREELVKKANQRLETDKCYQKCIGTLNGGSVTLKNYNEFMSCVQDKSC